LLDHVLFLRANLCVAVWLYAFVDSLSSKWSPDVVQINTATKFTRAIKRVDNSNPAGGGIMGLGNVLGNPLARGGARGGHHHHHKRRNPSGGQHRETIEYKVPLEGATQAHDFSTVTAYKVLPVS
jgi:hypothetical protein